MSFIKGIARIATGAATGFVLMSGVALADMTADLDAQAAEIEQAIAANPQYGAEEGPISVEAVDGRIVLTGSVGDLEQLNAIKEMLRDMEGLDLDLVDNNLVTL